VTHARNARRTERRRLLRCGTALAVSLFAAPAAAQPAAPRALRWDPVFDVTVVAVGATGGILSEELKPEIAPSRCRWCRVDPLDERVREALLWRDTAAADTTSNVIGFVVTPLAAGGLDALAAVHDGAARYAGEDILLIAEAGVLAADLTQLTKMLVARERPFVHALSSERKLLTAQPSDNNLSFFSGHTSVVFALATAAGTVTTMHGYRWAPAVWSVGLVTASTTGYLRIAADKHWLTDVLVGAAVGAAVGVFVPLAFHSAVDDPAKVTSTIGMRGPLPVVAIAW
jgi:membrane-associated phospholipid phosphatase